MTRRSVVVHGHFYQPPREDPWTDTVPRERSASPFHDWNERIHAECYRAVAAARLLDGEGRITGIVNTLEWISWDAGPTLLRWLARETPDTYQAFLEGDARSRDRLGFGNALAMPYHHIILPLASRRDKVTEVRWGIADFRRRFGREPEGMWLPEAAVDLETLDVLAAEGIRFTVLGPTQVQTIPAGGMPGRVSLPGGRSIAVFVYDGTLSHDVAFGGLLKDADAWMARMAEDEEEDRGLVSLATDGETFGHHQRWGDFALGAAVAAMQDRSDARMENYASFLAAHPPEEEIRIVDPSSWSCVHGVERWRAECGCKLAPHEHTQQKWRTVLRDALDELAGDLHARFTEEAGAMLNDPWAARDGFGAVLDRGTDAARRYVEAHAARDLSPEEAGRAVELLHMEHDALAMFTSCGWFFDDLARLEPLQVLRYAAHALDLLGEGSERLEERIRERLASAESNDPDAGDGRRLWDERIRGRRVTVSRAAPAPGSELTRAVERLVRGPSDTAAERVVALLDELKTRDEEIPFEARTVLARELGARDGGEVPLLLGVAERMGFSPQAPSARPVVARRPLDFVFGLHVHQPVGNFDEVFRAHAEDVYVPLLERLAERRFLPVAVHVSGPLLEWLETNAHPYLDLLARLADDGSIELLLSGFYEPILPVLSRADRLQQIAWMDEWLRSKLGVEAHGLWLTERIWDPELAEDLVDAGVRYVFADDRHFLISGFEHRELHRPFRTESGGKGLAVLPIDERLRYLIPFRPPEEIASYLRSLQASGHPLAVLADDGEKFGGWPGTKEWVWESGWLEDFLDTMETLADDGIVRLRAPGQAVAEVPSGGLAYLPTASYREMEGWSLPPAAALRLQRLDESLKESGASEDAQTLLRGGHWRNFLARYVESNRMHKKAMRLSALCRERGDPPEARRALGRAQCNDVYWHGVFGGLYLRHLRNAVWANLAEAEGILRRGEGLEARVVDLGVDGRDEVWIHSDRFSAVVGLTRGGAVTELTDFRTRRNLADMLTRRRESYHRVEARQPDAHAEEGDGGEGTFSIHDLEERLRLDALPPVDPDERAIFLDRILSGDLTPEEYASGSYPALRSWASQTMETELDVDDDTVVLHGRASGPGSLEKELRFEADGTLEVRYRWDPVSFPPDARFAPELSVGEEIELEMDPEPEDLWRYEIRTVSKSEHGFEETVQGTSLTPLWKVSDGAARIRIRRDS